VILDDRGIQSRFASGQRVSEMLRAFSADAGAVPVADFFWEVPAGGTAIVRHLRRMTSVGVISIVEEAPASTGPAWSLRGQLVTLAQAADIAMVRKEDADDAGFWELHVGDGDPRPVREVDLPAAFALVKAALEATARR